MRLKIVHFFTVGHDEIISILYHHKQKIHTLQFIITISVPFLSTESVKTTSTENNF